MKCGHKKWTYISVGDVSNNPVYSGSLRICLVCRQVELVVDDFRVMDNWEDGAIILCKEDTKKDG